MCQQYPMYPFTKICLIKIISDLDLLETHYWLFPPDIFKFTFFKFKFFFKYTLSQPNAQKQFTANPQL